MPRLIVPVAATLAAAGLLAACSAMPGAGPESASTAPASSSSASATEPGDQAQAATGQMDSEGIVTVGLVEPYSPASEGTSTDDYRCFLLDTGVPEDRFITGVRFMPDNPAVVHHAILYRVRSQQIDAAQARAGGQQTGHEAVQLGSGAVGLQARQGERQRFQTGQFGGLHGGHLLLALPGQHPIVAAGFLHGEPDMLEQDYQALSRQVDALLVRLRELHDETRQLHRQRQQLLAERDDLQRKNEHARARVEAIILRLKALEAQA